MTAAGAPRLLARLVDASITGRWLRAIDRRYARPVPSGTDGEIDRHSSSILVEAVDGLDLDALLRLVWPGPLAAACRQVLGQTVACDADRSWVRRQYAPGRYPPGHAAHTWHQDGALGFDFIAGADRLEAADALLEMATCWIALTRCGDVAPGLELLVEPQPRLCPLPRLAEASIRDRHAANAFVRPVLAAGDALLFDGGVVHRTHVTPQMASDRTSIELRFFAARTPPARLAGDRFIPIDF